MTPEPRLLKQIQGHLPKGAVIVSTSKGEDRKRHIVRSTVGTVLVVYLFNGEHYRTSLSIQIASKK